MDVQVPNDAFQIPPTDKLQHVVATLNRYLKLIRDRLDALEGMRGRSPVIHAAPDFQGHRIKNIGRSQSRKDALTRGEFDDFQRDVSMLEEQLGIIKKRLEAAGIE